MKFARPYRDQGPLVAAHLDELVRWPVAVTQRCAAAVAGYPAGGWGILHAASLDDCAERSIQARGDQLHWSEMLILMPNGNVTVLPAGRGDKPMRRLAGTADLSIEAAWSEGDTAADLAFAVGDALNWPVGFLGSTPELRGVLEGFQEALQAAVAGLDGAMGHHGPLLAAAQQLNPTTPAMAALPWLCALGQVLRCGPGATAPGWPAHPLLLQLLRDLTARLPGLQSTGEVGLEFVEATTFNGRSRREYRKRSGVPLEIVDLPGNSAGVSWAVAPVIDDCEQDMRSTREIRAEWTGFVVGFNEKFSPETRLLFRHARRRDSVYGPV